MSMPPQTAHSSPPCDSGGDSELSDLTTRGCGLRGLRHVRSRPQDCDLADLPFDSLLQSANLFPVLPLVALKVVYNTLSGSKVAFGVAQGGAQSFTGLDSFAFQCSGRPVPILFLPTARAGRRGRSRPPDLFRGRRFAGRLARDFADNAETSDVAEQRA